MLMMVAGASPEKVCAECSAVLYMHGRMNGTWGFLFQHVLMLVITRSQPLLLSSIMIGFSQISCHVRKILTLQCIWLLGMSLHHNKLARAQAKPAPVRALISGPRPLSVQDREAAEAKHCNAQLALHIYQVSVRADSIDPPHMHVSRGRQGMRTCCPKL